MEFNAIRIVIRSGQLSTDDAISLIERVALVARTAFVKSRSVVFAKRIKSDAGSLRGKEIA